MAKSIFKYMDPNIVEKALTVNGPEFKCSYPRDFNDPYELFLTIDFKDDPEVLAFYQDVIGELPQNPTTCFSLSPAITPMWAHYGKNLEGVVVHIDEQKLSKIFRKSNFESVVYKNEPSSNLVDLLYRALRIQKPRYFDFLMRETYFSAYFTKFKCWDYEQERRMVCSEDEVRIIDGKMLLKVPKDCVISLIVGPRASLEIQKFIKLYSQKYECMYFMMKIGKSTPEPYFVNNDNVPYFFSKESFEQCSAYCKECREPCVTTKSLCSWCAITDVHRENAMNANTFRKLSNAGLFEDYVKSMNEIIRKSGSPI